MDLLLWIIFGAVAGWIASMLMHTDGGQGTVMDIVLGIVGSVVGNYLFGLAGQSGVSGFNLYSMGVAIVGAVVIIYVRRLLRGR